MHRHFIPNPNHKHFLKLTIQTHFFLSGMFVFVEKKFITYTLHMLEDLLSHIVQICHKSPLSDPGNHVTSQTDRLLFVLWNWPHVRTTSHTIFILRLDHCTTHDSHRKFFRLQQDLFTAGRRHANCNPVRGACLDLVLLDSGCYSLTLTFLPKKVRTQRNKQMQTYATPKVHDPHLPTRSHT